MANRVNDHLERSKQYLKKVDWNLLYKLLVSNVVAGDYVSTELIDFGSRVLAEKEIKEGTLYPLLTRLKNAGLVEVVT